MQFNLLTYFVTQLNTFGHSFFALCIYWLWWNKPLDIQEQTLIRGPSMRETSAVAWAGSTRSGDYWANRSPKTLFRSDELGLIFGGLYVEESHAIPNHGSTVEFGFTNTLVSLAAEWLSMLHPGTDYDRTTSFPSKSEIRFEEGKTTLRLNRADAERWNLLQNAMQNNSFPQDQIWIERWKYVNNNRAVTASFMDPDETRLVHGPSSVDRCSNRLSLSVLPHDSQRWSAMLLFVLATSLYGGLHEIAWSAPFRTKTEALLWRISGTVVASFGPLAVVSYLVLRRHPSLGYLIGSSLRSCVIDRSIGTFFNNVVPVCDYVLLILACILYILARSYLVVECLMALFHSQPGVFETPRWTQYLPHLG